ncbi:short-chain dehydrogenase reductase [Paraphaeosphaeria minitans]|uniref:Short-chain dehydrogenase reductase n=1 Tax=Paraphaeosphaeria minitans TaxID=565426 RepID=A0A9P6G7A3_9PLEO|nr:short-chain dehydrogenase reductase [Paraphaeosphaeria minitans]
MASTKLSGIALVTGVRLVSPPFDQTDRPLKAASGIGKDTAFAFAEAGALRVVFADRNEAGAKDAAQASKAHASNPAYSAVAVHVDVTDVSSVQKMVDVALEGEGRIDHFVHSAGQVGSESFSLISDASLEEFDRLLDVNLKGTLICNRAILKVMGAQEPRTFHGRHGSRDVGRGTIVNVGSMNSLFPLPGKIPYTASKHGVHAVTRTAAIETVRAGIRVNMVCPTWVVTPMTDAERERNPTLDGLIKTAMPAGRMAFPDEVADVIVFYSSPATSYITGQAIVIDNGVSLTVRL